MSFWSFFETSTVLASSVLVWHIILLFLLLLRAEVISIIIIVHTTHLPIPPRTLRHKSVIVPHTPHPIGNIQPIHLPRISTRGPVHVRPEHAADHRSFQGRHCRRRRRVRSGYGHGAGATSRRSRRSVLVIAAAPVFVERGEVRSSPGKRRDATHGCRLRSIAIRSRHAIPRRYTTNPATHYSAASRQQRFLPRLAGSGTHAIPPFPLVHCPIAVVHRAHSVGRAGGAIDLAGVPSVFPVGVRVGHARHACCLGGFAVLLAAAGGAHGAAAAPADRGSAADGGLAVVGVILPFASRGMRVGRYGDGGRGPDRSTVVVLLRPSSVGIISRPG
mmetsp:Transcript_34247/g.55935  ORF Transcript_34247/g.55935 Transcript_34247/m.55935 type:complete len:331 (-) Transcript_34247:697-1689(-)